MASTHRYDCIVVGGGPTGFAAAAALASGGLAVALASDRPQPGPPDRLVAGETRTAALFPPSIAMLEKLGAWDSLRPACAPIRAIRLIDGSRSLLRAPEVLFRASDIGLADLGYNVPNADLTVALAAAATRCGANVLYDSRVDRIEVGADAVSISTNDTFQLEAPLIVAADGRNSPARGAAGISARRRPCGQRALATSFHHGRPHRGISTEVNAENGPCTTVPLNGQSSSLVWMHAPEEIGRLHALSPEAFLERLSERLEGLLGSLSELGPRRDFDLVGLVAEKMARNRVALVGEAAHAFPPIGAQGLNLGLADVAVLADLVASARRRNADVGGAAVLQAYHRERHGEVSRRAGAVDLLNRSQQPGIIPLWLMRGAGLHALAGLPALRRKLMLEGLYPPAPVPSLMRPHGASVGTATASAY